MYKVYILFSVYLNKFYIGQSSDNIDERIRKHNSNHGGFTSRASDWQLVYSENYDDKITALKREKEIKSWKSRKKICELIEKDRASR